MSSHSKRQAPIMTPQALLTSHEFQSQFQRIKHVARYDSRTEKKIAHPWWDLNIDGIDANSRDISGCIASTTNGVFGLDRELEHVTKTAARLDQIERAPAIKVALIGAQGAGKSLLINALFDCTGLSLTGAKGFACTSTIVKYAYGPGNKFAAEVRFLNAKMREEMIDEHIRSYIDYHNDLEDSDNEEGPRTRSQKQDEIDRKRKKTAEDFFDTIFGSRTEFTTAWCASPINTNEFKSLCQLKCKEAMEIFDMNSQGVALFTKNTPAELLKEVKPFLSNVDDTVCLWPIVDCVTIRFNHPLLQQGLEIIDLPGSGDINMLRARHADEVKDTVDVEIILADTGRIGTDDLLISTARAGMLNHGASRVKVVATKIDVISDDELAQYTDGIYDQINSLMSKADEDAITADEAGEDAKVAQISRYKQYLHRYKKSYMVQERAGNISKVLGETLRGVSKDDQVKIMHTSTADYMNWIKSEKIAFNAQPALSPEETGVPMIRKYLFSLPASQNLRDYVNHIGTAIPAFSEKLKRVVTQSDRDAGFKTIAIEFDDFRARFLGDMFKQIQWHYVTYSRDSVGKIRRDANAYKQLVDSRLQKKWLSLKSAAFTRILKNRGTVPQGTSKAKGLEKDVNWNAELASSLKPGFQRWFDTHTEHLKDLKAALPLGLERLHHETMSIMNRSAANLITVEKAKLKWRPLRHRMLSKLGAMMEEMLQEEKRFKHRATLEDERDNNIIAAITDKIYDDVFTSIPDLKSAPGKPKRYVTPVLKFRKDRLTGHFLDPKSHFVDKVIDLFQKQLEDKMRSLIEKHFVKLNAMFDDFSKLLHEHAPVDFDINPMGEAIREKLSEQISYIDGKVETLKDLLPASVREENDTAAGTDDFLEENGGQTQDLSYFLDKVGKRKRTSGNGSATGGKRIKTEAF